MLEFGATDKMFEVKISNRRLAEYYLKEIVGLSSQSKQIIADKSDHLIPRHQPEIIIQAVRERMTLIRE